LSVQLKDRILKTLLESKIIDQIQLDKAVQFQKEKGGTLSQILLDLGFVKQKEILLALGQNLNIPLIDLNKYNTDPSVIDLIPKAIARRYKILPLSKIGATITIAVSDPLNIFAIDDIKNLTGFDARLVLAEDSSISAAIEQYYGRHAHEELEKTIKEMADFDIAASRQAEQITKPEDIIKLTQEMPIVRTVNMILSDGVHLKASDILIEPMEHDTRIRYRIDGLLQTARNLPISLHEAIISRIKVMSELDIAEMRLPQDGRFKLKARDRFVDFRISILPSSYGEKAGIRVLDQENATLDIAKLGFTGYSLSALKENSLRPHGMILACGPTGSGKTTTLYSILNFIDNPEKNIVTVEDPIEFDLKGINQVNVRPEVGLTFASSLRSILRQDPDIIMIGEMRDFDTLDVAIKAALTGHLVLSTIHTNTAPGAITRMINMGLEPFLVSSSVAMIAAQRLVRKICEKCKEPYEITDEARKTIDIKGRRSPVFYKGRGCNFCLGTGYKGRIGIMEVLTVDSDIRRLIMDSAAEAKIKECARNSGMITLREDGIAKARDGITTIEEVVRVTVGDQD
jgi:type IV pilus assembly protein PilB